MGRRLFLYMACITMIIFFSSCEKEVSTTPETEPVLNGKIVFHSEPQGAQIFVNGNNTGKVTPDSIIHIASGLYRTMYRLSPYLDIIDSVYIVAENAETIYKNFFDDNRNFGEINCISNPAGASIWVNDSSTGLTTPATLKPLWPGTYKITCSLNQHRDETRYIAISGGQTKSSSFFPQDTSICVDYNYYNSEFPATHTTSVAVDHNGVKWIGNYPGGVVKIENGEWTYLNPSNSPLHDNSITCIEIDNENNKWFGTSTGVAKLDNEGNWTVFAKEYLDYIMAIACDNSGYTWISSTNFTSRRRLQRYKDGEWLGWVYPGARVIVCLTVDNEDRLWAGLDQGLMVLENNEWALPPGDYQHADPMVKYYSAEAIEYDPRGFIWIGYGSTLGGPGDMYIFDGENYNHFPLPEKYISHIHIAANQNLWVSCHGDYTRSNPLESTPLLMKIDPDFNITGYSENDIKISSRMLKWSWADINGDLWIASRDKGIIKFKGANL